MKNYVIYMLIIAAVLGFGLMHQYGRTTAPEQAVVEGAAPQFQTDAPKTESPEPKPDIRSMLPAPPEPQPEPVAKATPPQKKAAVPKVKQKIDPDVVRRQRAAQYWKSMAQRFNRQKKVLSQEKNQAKRNNMIRTMAGNVRIDTLSTLDWAMNLENPDEQRLALEAINKNALSGIGARIEMDARGLPKIKETTVLSAVASTGLVEDGDYIAGMVGEDGRAVYFKGLSVKDIVGFLRGKPGTEIQLLMERVPTAGSSQPIPFDVLVQRSMIVMQPPF